MSGIQMTMPSTRLFGHNLGDVTESILALHLRADHKVVPSLSDVLRIKRRELLKKRLFQGKGALAYDCFHHLKKMLPVQLAHVKFCSTFDKSRKDKRALINAASIFFSSSGSSMSTKRHLGLESKRRKINAALLHWLTCWGMDISLHQGHRVLLHCGRTGEVK